MASINTSDMFSRKVFISALRAGLTQRGSPTPLTLAEFAGLSTYDRPSAPTVEENAFYDKYKDKLNTLKSQRPDEYSSALDNIYGKNRNKKVKNEDGINKIGTEIKGSTMLDKMKQSSADAREKAAEKPEKKGLDSILKLDMIKDLPSSEITKLWSQYFSDKEGIIFASIPSEKYNRLKAKGTEFPLFLYALPRDSGYEFVLGQYSADDWYYTPLIAYQSHGEYAPYCLAVHHYTELSESKGLVLMKGEISSNDIKPELATLLVHQTQLMYGSDENFSLVEKMNKKPDEFKHMEVIDLYKKVGMF